MDRIVSMNCAGSVHTAGAPERRTYLRLIRNNLERSVVYSASLLPAEG